MPKFRSAIADGIYKQLTATHSLSTQQIGSELKELVLHVSEGCNLACSYCFADRGRYGKSDSRWMTAELARESTSAMLSRYERINSIKFFGGEPLLNIEAIEAVCSLFRERAARPPRYRMVTNMTVYNERVRHLLNDNNISVTASIDGPEVVHDHFRKFENGAGSFSKVDTNIRRMTADTGQPTTLEVVYGPHHLAQGLSMIDVHKFLETEYGNKNIIIHAMKLDVSTVLSIADDLRHEYLESIYDISVDYGRFYVSNCINNKTFHWLARPLGQILTQTQSDTHCGLGVGTLTVSASGSLLPCYTLSSRPEYEMCSDVTRTTEEDNIRIATIQSSFVSSRKSTNPACTECSIMPTCKTCPGANLSGNGSLERPSQEICDYVAGTTEGIMLGLNDKGSESGHFRDIIKELEAIAV
jgi:uncharacterized protein